MTIQQARKIHCIGIGGIGVSALAQLWRAQEKEVSGFDDSKIQNSKFKIQHDTDLIIYSDAVPEDHPQRIQARQQGIPELSYAEALGQVSAHYKTIVVTGTHGKSTTTALLGLMLEAAQLDPLVIVGSKVPGWENSNLRLSAKSCHPQSGSRINNSIMDFRLRGNDKDCGWFVVEGDDYRDHFLELRPYAVVVTSIEWDHPDYFRDLEQTVESFKKLVEKVLPEGFIVINKDDFGCRQLNLQTQHSDILKNVRMLVYGRGSEVFDKLQLQVPGEFNRHNATGAATAASELGVSREIIEKVTREFKGVWRRFEVVGELPPPLVPPRAGGPISSPLGGEVRRGAVTIISDYGHHPTAIRATMKAARQAYPGRRLVLVYQPHQHSRTKRLFQDFVEALKDAADLVILSEIYAVKGRLEDQDVNSQLLVDRIKDEGLRIKQVLYGGDLKQTKRMVLEKIQPGDVLIFMGAGDVDSIARDLVPKDNATKVT